MKNWQYMLINIAMFQIGWAACVLGGNKVAVIYTLTALLLHGYYFIKSRKEVIIIIAFTLVGVIWDSFLIYRGALNFSDSPAFTPLWLACLWLLFACTLNHSLAWLKSKLLIAAVLGAVAAPLSYLAGIKLGAASVLISLPASLLIIALGWMIILPMGLYATRWCRNV